MAGEQVTITFQRAWDEWLPRCTCGWDGSYTPMKSRARTEGERHIAEKHPEEQS